MRCSRPDARARRRGTMLLETTATALLIGAALVLVARLLGGLAAADREAERRHWALHEAQNTLERLLVQPWEDLADPEAAGEWSRLRSERAAEVLPGGVVEVVIAEDADVPGALRLAVEVRWDGPSGTATRPVRLVSWAYRLDQGGER